MKKENLVKIADFITALLIFTISFLWLFL